MGKTVYENENDPSSRGKIRTDLLIFCRLPLGLFSLYSSYNTTVL